VSRRNSVIDQRTDNNAASVGNPSGVISPSKQPAWKKAKVDEEDKPFRCTLCTSRLMERAKLASNLQGKHFICMYCHQRFSTHLLVLAHIATDHPRSSLPRANHTTNPFIATAPASSANDNDNPGNSTGTVGPIVKAWSCTLCPKEYARRTECATHLQAVHFQCPSCHQVFPTQVELVSHEKSHPRSPRSRFNHTKNPLMKAITSSANNPDSTSIDSARLDSTRNDNIGQITALFHWTLCLTSFTTRYEVAIHLHNIHLRCAVCYRGFITRSSIIWKPVTLDPLYLALTITRTTLSDLRRRLQTSTPTSSRYLILLIVVFVSGCLHG
jgi:predicted SprT family Zn-dependent metalloprotease